MLGGGGEGCAPIIHQWEVREVGGQHAVGAELGEARS